MTDAGRVAGFMPVPAHRLVRWQSGQMRPAVTRLIFIYAGSNPARTTTGLTTPLREVTSVLHPHAVLYDGGMHCAP